MPKPPSSDPNAQRFAKPLLVAGVALVAVLVGVLLYLDAQLDSVRDALRYREPTGKGPAHATLDGDLLEPVQGQLVYVPAYSHIYHHDGKSYLLTVTLSVRNTDSEGAIVVNSVRYYDTEGKLVKSHLQSPLRVAPLATTEFLVERDDRSGGSGANFLVEWVAEQPVSEPIIETVMIDTRGQQGISFARQGKVVREKEARSSHPSRD